MSSAITGSGMERLAAATDAFFRIHWSNDALGIPPSWTSWVPFLQASVPAFDQGGCYALFIGADLSYVGLGASRGGGRYMESGLSRRLMSHVYKSAGGTALALREPWLEVTGLATLGMGARAYLAPALESFLIRELAPPRNRRV